MDLGTSKKLSKNLIRFKAYFFAKMELFALGCNENSIKKISGTGPCVLALNPTSPHLLPTIINQPLSCPDKNLTCEREYPREIYYFHSRDYWTVNH